LNIDSSHDLVIVNANIYSLDPATPRAEALAAKDGRILALGSNQSVLAVAAQEIPASPAIDLGGKTVLPGFIDAHTHFLAGGFSIQSVNLRGCSGPAEFIDRIAERVRLAKPDQWVTGGGWDQETWPGSPLPCKEWIDSFSDSTPVFMNRSDLHIGLANSAALRAANIDANTPDPCGGEIFRDSTGNPTGILKDAAIRLLETAMPKPSAAAQESALRLALAQAASQGVTSVHDVTDWGNASWSEWALFQRFRQYNELTCRIFARLPLIDWDRCRDELPAFLSGPHADPWLRFGGLKGFTDGSLGGHTAFFFDPYTDAPDTCGLLLPDMFPSGSMERRIREADLAGIPVSIHAIGDRANSILLDIFESVAKTNGPRDRRFRIEHAQHLKQSDIDRMGRMGVIASVQPAHLIDDGGWADRGIGAVRSQLTYAFLSLVKAGVLLAGGSDWPVAPMSPLLGIHAAVNRNTADGQFPNGWIPKQKLSVTQAIEAFTTGAAYAEFAEADKGTLTPGKFADLVVLSADPYQIAATDIKDIQVLMTFVDGSPVYKKQRN
jgi:predicted amidohydrolase YtcJ